MMILISNSNIIIISNDWKIHIIYCYFTCFNSRNNNNIHSQVWKEMKWLMAIQ